MIDTWSNDKRNKEKQKSKGQNNLCKSELTLTVFCGVDGGDLRYCGNI